MNKILLASAAVVALGTAASAAPITGGETTVEVTAPLDVLGLGGAPFGSATTDGAVFTFPITGGEADDDGAVIEHEGSGVTLFALADEAIAATVGNFVIDTAEAGVLGDVIGGAEDLTLFDFGEAGETGIPLLITTTLAGALTEVFGADDLTGAEFGLANTAPVVDDAGTPPTGPAPIPLPAAFPLLAAGLLGLGAVARRRRT